MAGRFAASRMLVRQSFEILRQDKELIWYPVLGGLISLVFLASFIVPMSLVIGGDQVESATNDPLGLAIMFAYYLGLSFITTFFNVGLVAAAIHRMNGGNPTFSYGWNAAASRIGKIFVWSLISATVGVILKLIENKGGIFGKIASMLVGFAWSLLTFFIVPVILLENLSVTDSIKRSGVLFKETWGENVIGNVTMSLFFIPLMLIGIIPFLVTTFWIFIGFFGEVANFGAIVVGWLASGAYLVLLGVVFSALNGIFKTALYRFATTKQAPPGFDPELIQTAFRQKGSSPVVPTTSPTSFSG